MRMTREEREQKFRRVRMSSNLDAIWDFIAELMVDLNSADSDMQRQREMYERAAQLRESGKGK